MKGKRGKKKGKDSRSSPNWLRRAMIIRFRETLVREIMAKKRGGSNCKRLRHRSYAEKKGEKEGNLLSAFTKKPTPCNIRGKKKKRG